MARPNLKYVKKSEGRSRDFRVKTHTRFDTGPVPLLSLCRHGRCPVSTHLFSVGTGVPVNHCPFSLLVPIPLGPFRAQSTISSFVGLTRLRPPAPPCVPLHPTALRRSSPRRHLWVPRDVRCIDSDPPLPFSTSTSVTFGLPVPGPLGSVPTLK